MDINVKKKKQVTVSIANLADITRTNEHAQVSLNRRITTLRKKSYNRYLWFYYYHLVDTTAGGLLVPKVSATVVI